MMMTYSANLQNEIRDRIQAEQALRQSEEMFSKAFGLSPIGILISQYPSGRIVSANDSFLQATGYAREVVLEHSLAELGICPDLGVLTDIRSALSRERRVRNHALEFVTRAGDTRHGLISADLIELWGEPYVLAVMEDVTARRQMEERILAISENERRARLSKPSTAIRRTW
jgi:PAS domain S-box-containing protein